MKVMFTETAWQDYLWFLGDDKQLLKRVNDLIKDVTRNPFTGLGKPEPLKENLSGYWSRRVNDQHRFVYQISENTVKIISCRYHYH